MHQQIVHTPWGGCTAAVAARGGAATARARRLAARGGGGPHRAARLGRTRRRGVGGRPRPPPTVRGARQQPPVSAAKPPPWRTGRPPDNADGVSATWTASLTRGADGAAAARRLPQRRGWYLCGTGGVSAAHVAAERRPWRSIAWAVYRPSVWRRFQRATPVVQTHLAGRPHCRRWP